METHDRATGIGGSEAGAVLGLNPWTTPLDVYLRKIGEAEEFEGNAATFWGTKLEAVVAEVLAEKRGIKLRRRNATLRSDKYPWMTGHIDREVVGEKILVEIKTASQYTMDRWGPEDTEEFPDEYKAQIEHYFELTGYEQALLAVLIGGRDFRVYEYLRDDDFHEILLEREREFWQEHVVKRVPPPPTTVDDILALYPSDDESVAVADERTLDAIASLRDVKAQLKELTEAKKNLEFQVKAAMGPAAVLTGPSGGTLATWKAQTRRTIDTKRLRAEMPEIADELTTESTIRVLRLK